ncbi:MAG: hypothetical protein ACYSSL_10260 [Planctomycetota bacterium]|jgi:hypothetical protein
MKRLIIVLTLTVFICVFSPTAKAVSSAKYDYIFDLKSFCTLDVSTPTIFAEATYPQYGCDDRLADGPFFSNDHCWNIWNGPADSKSNFNSISALLTANELDLQMDYPVITAEFLVNVVEDSYEPIYEVRINFNQLQSIDIPDTGIIPL